MPLECVDIRCAAQNQTVSGSLVRCSAVPAVIEVCRPQSEHSKVYARLRSAAARPSPHTGQTNPSAHRRLNKNAAPLASSGNSFWNSVSERALAIGCPVAAPHGGSIRAGYHIEVSLGQRNKPYGSCRHSTKMHRRLPDSSTRQPKAPRRLPVASPETPPSHRAPTRSACCDLLRWLLPRLDDRGLNWR